MSMRIDIANKILLAVHAASNLKYAHNPESLEYHVHEGEDMCFGTNQGSMMEDIHSPKDLRDAEAMAIYLKKVFEVECRTEAHDSWVFLIIKTT
jgi:hypothetical protein